MRGRTRERIRGWVRMRVKTEEQSGGEVER